MKKQQTNIIQLGNSHLSPEQCASQDAITDAKRLRQKKRTGLEFITAKVGEAEKSHDEAVDRLAGLEEIQLGERAQLARHRATQMIKGEELKAPAASSTAVRIAAAREEMEITAATLQELRDMRAQATADLEAAHVAVAAAVDAALDALAESEYDEFVEALDKFKGIGHRLLWRLGSGLNQSIAQRYRVQSRPDVSKALAVFESIESQTNIDTPVGVNRLMRGRSQLERQRQEMIDSDQDAQLESAA